MLFSPIATQQLVSNVYIILSWGVLQQCVYETEIHESLTHRKV